MKFKQVKYDGVKHSRPVLRPGASAMGSGLPAARILLAAVLTLLMVFGTGISPAFAAGTGDTPDGSSLTIQQAAGEHGSTATVTLGKILTCSRENDFPPISDFVFTIDALRGWDNANAAADQSGADIAASQMPMPAASDTAHQKVSVTGTRAAVQVGDFLNPAADNQSTGDGDDSASRRTRTTAVRITFTKAGYYLYQVKEAGSLPGSGAGGTDPVRTVPGVDYDDNEYFMVFYVCNKVDAQGNTTDGVYVHSITSYANESGDDSYQPNLSDIRGTTDNGGNAAGNNSGQVGADGSVTHTLGKVGVSDPTTPNQLEAYRMWSAYVSRDLVVKKNVTGNLGDRTKTFAFTVTLTGLQAGATYSTGAAAADTGDASTVEILSADVGTRKSGTSFTSDASGHAVLQIRMKDDDAFVVNGLPLTAQYAVREGASDHVASYTVVSSNQAAGSGAAVITAASGTNGSNAGQALTTGTESVDRTDGTVTITFTNNRDLATITGVPGLDYMLYAGLALVLAAAVFLLLGRRRRYAGAGDMQAQRVDS